MSDVKGRKRKIYTLAALCAGCMIFFAASLLLGSVSLPWGGLFDAMRQDDVTARILWGIRLPRVLAAFFLGGALALAGYMMQIFFHNPLAGPFVLGISSSAKLVVALTLVFGLGSGFAISSWTLVAAAFVGALMSMGIVSLMAGRIGGRSTLVVCGVMTGYICSALTDLVVTFADDSDIVNLHNWSLGSFSGISWQQIRVLVPIVTVSFLWTFGLSKPIGALLGGEAYAGSIGVNVKALRISFVLLSCFLSGTVVAFAGPISFVGIAVPYLIRSLMKTEQPLWVIPGCFLGGGLMCMVCDLTARCLFAPIELSISTVTACFGAPVVLVMLLGKESRRED